jgi:hypothetical protein
MGGATLRAPFRRGLACLEAHRWMGPTFVASGGAVDDVVVPAERLNLAGGAGSEARFARWPPQVRGSAAIRSAIADPTVRAQRDSMVEAIVLGTA